MLTLYRFVLHTEGVVDVRAPSEALAWAELRSVFPAGAVVSGPTPVATAPHRPVRLIDILGTEGSWR